ncbi:hypothetical protein D3C87_1978850 [compost metagenome]
MLVDVAVHFLYFFIGKSGVSFRNRDQLISFSYGKSVIGIICTSAAAAFLCIDQYCIYGVRIYFPFPPVSFLSARMVWRIFMFQHQALTVD